MKIQIAIGSAVIIAVGALQAVSRLRLQRGPSRDSWSRLVFGHRGCRETPGIPENTIEAFEHAAKGGCHGIELDVRLTKDKRLVVFHDPTLSPMLEGAPNDAAHISDFTLSQLKAMHYRDDTAGGIVIPTLEETLTFCMKHNLKVLIEVKERRDLDTMLDALLALYDELGADFMYENTMTICFDPIFLYKLRWRNPRIATGQLFCGRVPVSWLQEHPVSFWLRVMNRKVLDWLLSFTATVVAPRMSGVSALLPKYDMFNPQLLSAANSLNLCVLLWGFPLSMDPSCAVTTHMKSFGVSTIIDGQYSEFLLLLK